MLPALQGAQSIKEMHFFTSHGTPETKMAAYCTEREAKMRAICGSLRHEEASLQPPDLIVCAEHTNLSSLKRNVRGLM